MGRDEAVRGVDLEDPTHVAASWRSVPFDGSSAVRTAAACRSHPCLDVVLASNGAPRGPDEWLFHAFSSTTCPCFVHFALSGPRNGTARRLPSHGSSFRPRPSCFATQRHRCASPRPTCDVATWPRGHHRSSIRKPRRKHLHHPSDLPRGTLASLGGGQKLREGELVG